MQLYEMMFILDPDLGQEEREKILGRIASLADKNGGEVINLMAQGMKRLAYKINKKPRGQYFLAYLEGPGAMVAELERVLRIDENVMRFIFIKLDPPVTREDLLPKEEPKVEEAPAEEPKAEEAPAEEPKAEEAPTEEPKVEEAPAEEPKAEVQAETQEQATEEVSE